MCLKSRINAKSVRYTATRWPAGGIKQQSSRGFLLPLAAILVFGVGILAAAISRFTSQTSYASVLEGISAQAFYAAESGAYYGMNRILYDVDSRSTSDANCLALNASGGTTLNFAGIQGLSSCSTVVSCSISAPIAGEPTSFYEVLSEAECGSGDILAQRAVRVSTYF